MKPLRELTIMTPNKPGKLSQVLRALAAAKVNLVAIDSSSGYDLNLVRLITSDANTARRVLGKLGYQVTEATVLTFTVVHQPGALAKVTAALGKAKININYMYATAAAPGGTALVVIHVSDAAAAETALAKAT